MQLRHYKPMRTANACGTNPGTFFDGLFDDFFGPTVHLANASGKNDRKVLQVDIYEKENVIIIEADMPGMTKEGITLDVKGKCITLKGERTRDEEVKEEHLYRRERFFGTYERSFNLPFEIDTETVQAKFEHGTLRLEIPKPEQKQAKQIAIN